MNVKLEVFTPVVTDAVVLCGMMCYTAIDKYEHPREKRNFLLQGKRVSKIATGSSETSARIYSVS